MLYDPFKEFSFDLNTCFLSGHSLQSADEVIQVIPTWLMQEFALEDKPIKMLDEHILTYKQLKMPCSALVAERLDVLEQQIQSAFLQGYDQVSQLDRMLLFQWISKLVYGMVFNEIRSGLKQQQILGEPINFSIALAHKFKNLHYMLQSLISPIQFDGALPYTITVVKLDNPEDTFSYRDEINTLVFSMRLRDFGIVACLQDNGTNGVYHESYLEKVKDQVLHPIQFEELCARFFYSGYLFSRLPEYTLVQTPEKTYIEPMSLVEMSMKPLFDQWQVKTFGQVLENFWKPWGFTLFEIIKDPDSPMTFLTDLEGNFRLNTTIDLPIEGNLN